jgi:hypothetical protein
MINTTEPAASSSLASAGNVLFKMNCSVKQILAAGFATSLIAMGVFAQITPFGGDTPLFFEANRGQVGNSAQFLTRGRDSQFLISPTQAQMVLRKAEGLATVRMQFMGANPQAQIRGEAELPGKINYLTGNDPARWQTGVATFARVRVAEIYPGIGLVYYGNQQQLEYDFEIAPGANPDAIRIHFDGVDAITLNAQGGLVLTLSGGEIRQLKPVFCQTVNGARREISGGYQLLDGHTISFVVGSYDHSLPLVIDPLLYYSTYFGGKYGDTAWSVKLDANGFVYVAGATLSPQFLTNTPGAYQTNSGGSQTGDAFVAKFDNLGETLIYFTYLGGSGDDAAYGLAVDTNGDAYIAGVTDSTNFPVRNGIYTNISGTLNTQLGLYPVDAFVAELDPGGSNLVYSTYLGGESADAAFGIAVDLAGNAYVTGFTYSTNFPVKSPVPYHLAGTTNLYLNRLACTNTVYFNANAFVAKIAPGGTNLIYSTYFGGNNFDVGQGIAVDNLNQVYVTGYTASTNFPTVNAVYQQFVYETIITNSTSTNQVFTTNLFNGYLLNGSTNQTSASDAFIAKFDSTGTNLLYSTFLGGTNNDMAYAIAADNNGAAYVTGWTVSTNFPNTVTNIPYLHNGVTNNFNTVFPTVTNAFLTEITNGTGTRAGIAFSTVFGGTNRCIDIGYGVAIDTNTGNIFVVGTTSSTNFPTFNVPGLLRSTNSGKSDVFVIAFETNATALLYSTYLGGKDNDYGYSIAVDTETNVYVVGQTLSTNFPTLYAYQSSRNGTNDAFLAAILYTVPAPEPITTEPVSQTNEVGSTISFSIAGTAYPPFFFQWQEGDTNFVGTNLVDGGRISGATTNKLTISNAQTNDSGNYWVVVTNYGGSVTSDIVVLSVTNVAPEFTQPTNQTVGVGATATFSVTVTNGTLPLSYQWEFNGSPLTNGVQNGAHISGATNATLTITNVQPADAGIYLVIVSNVVRSVTSSNAVLTVVTAPQITNQPTSQSNWVGSIVTFSVGAVGQVPLRYQWQTTNGPNWVNLVNGGGHFVGVFTNSLSITNAQTTNTGFYRVVVTNVVGSVTSSPAFLSVTNIPPAITVQPTNQTVGVGSTATLSVSVNANATPPLRYQWQTNGVNLVNGGNISGATNATLTISNVKTNNSGSYSVIVTNYGGSATSSNAVLTVVAAPVIIVQPPTNQVMAVGFTATFSVYAVGQAPLSYQWQFNGTNLVNEGNISGATNNLLTINNAQTSDSGIYTVSVANLAGSVTSSNAVLLVTNSPPAINVQPTNQTVAAKSTVTMVVVASGTAPLSYQWQMNGTNLVNSGQGGQIGGATAHQLTIKNVQTNNSGSYSVIVTNFGGSVTSSVAVLTVASSPLILVQPTNQTMAVGATATLAVTAIGLAPLSYQWQMDGTNLTDGGQINGAISNVLTISNVQLTNSGSYSVVVTNTAGSVTSSNAVLSVVPLSFANIVAAGGGSFVLSGAGGTNNGTYFVLTSSNLLVPLAQWQCIATNQFDNAGDFIFTNTVSTNTPQLFYILQLP